MNQVTVVIPAYNEAESIPLFLKETKAVTDSMTGFSFQFLFVNDGSTDQTLELLRKTAKEDPAVRYLSFSRNFGKEAAIYAGLSHAEGDYVILIDADLQHPPALIRDMLSAVSSGEYQAAGAKRKSSSSSRLFTSVHNRISSVRIEKGATDYMCMSRQYVDAVLLLSERQRFSKGLFAWVGFDIRWFTYEQGPRMRGKSKWNSGKLFSYAADGITSFSTVPLRIVTIAGSIISTLALIYIVITLIRTFIYGIDVPGYVTTLCAILFMGGAVMLALGILGAYIGRIYMEAKERPMYILQEKSLPGTVEDEEKKNEKEDR